MHDKFCSCTVDVKADMVIFNNPRVNPVVCVYRNLYHYAPRDVSDRYGSFQMCTVNVHTHALN